MTRATGQPAPVTLPLRPSDARRELKALLAGTRWCRDADSVALAVHEAIVNAELHGGGAVRVNAAINGDGLEVAVCDRGPGFEIPRSDREAAVSADPFAEDGRGLWLICRIASQAETGWNDGDFCLRMRFDPPGRSTRR